MQPFNQETPQRPAWPRAALYDDGNSTLRALAVTGSDQDDNAREYIELFLHLHFSLEKLRTKITALIEKHAANAAYGDRARELFNTRVELVRLEMEMALSDWWPGMRGLDYRN